VRVLLVSANREHLPSPVVPLGPLAVAAAIRDEHEVRLADLCFEEEPHRALERAIADFDPEVVGVGLRNLHTNAYDGTERLLSEYGAVVDTIRRLTRAPVVLGGAAYSLRPELLLARFSGDYGVVGEGEQTFRSVLRGLAAGRQPDRITRARAGTGVVTRSLVRRDARWPPSELDELPAPARDLVDPRYYEFDGTDNLQTKRGCAFACAYCDYPDLEGNKVRVRDPDAVADEVLARSRVPGVTHMFFVDSVFNVPRSHALAVCDALGERGVPLPWVCYGSPAAFDDELVGAMARAGCQGVEIGSDAGTERMLERLHKPFGLEEIVKTRELFEAHGVHDCHTFVLGAFDETPDEVRRTLDFVDRLAPRVAVFIVFMEDREAMTIHRARHRPAILELLAEEAPRRAGWVVPELGIRFGPKVTNLVRRRGIRGPAWLELAKASGPYAARPPRAGGMD
jgi:hypothetical protein